VVKKSTLQGQGAALFLDILRSDIFFSFVHSSSIRAISATWRTPTAGRRAILLLFDTFCVRVHL
jgi:hypothetical protein